MPGHTILFGTIGEFFSKDLPHCLLRQLEARQELTPELNQIIRYHLDDIAAGKINTITQKLSMSTQDVRKCIAKIRELNPQPNLWISY